MPSTTKSGSNSSRGPLDPTIKWMINDLACGDEKVYCLQYLNTFVLVSLLTFVQCVHS